jgi:amidase
MRLATVAAWVALGCTPQEPSMTDAPPSEPPSEQAKPTGVVARTAWLAETDAVTQRARLAAGELDWRELFDQHAERIRALDRVGPQLHAVIALAEPAAPQGGADAPLYGLPVLIKDNIDVAGLPTTAGSQVLAAHRPADDAFLVARLREAGAVVLGKANLSEWANFRSTGSSSGWSGVGGLARNAHDPTRTACGSSSGSAVAVAAGFAPLAIGTETDGSILCPASINGVVGVKPTLGLVSRDGIVPIAPSQDTAGPLARTVADAALLLEAMAVVDPADPAAAARPPGLDTRYTAGLSDGALEGARIGVARDLGSFSPAVDAVFDRAVRDLRRLGAETVEVPLKLPANVGAAELDTLLHAFRPALEAYLQTVDPALGLRTFDDVIAATAAIPEELRWFDQGLFVQAAAMDRDDDEQADRIAMMRRVAGAEGIDATLAAHRLDAIVAPTTGPAWKIDLVNGDNYTGGTSEITAVSGYPAVTVPMGQVFGLPVGLSFIGSAWTEARLLSLAHSYERGTAHHQVPKLDGFRRE